ncbi:MAG TPA: 23S rRNA methyltransferase [Actinophytocola sp.]|jgi:23S rRNA (guanine745-N1)-methyltransferase|uniref:putative RNA methyltransferase n=1 Tax=Actinophytocola sp. TaxID=1872138 RepID=UPI002F936FCE
MLADVLPFLECPHCHADLTPAGPAVRCAEGHGFDVARQGYVSLLSGKASVAGDSADMVAARAAFLDAGHYAPIRRAVAGAAGTAGGCVADLGAGTGHYLAAVLDAEPDRVGLALEISKPALRRAARAHPRLGAVGCDAWGRLPVRDGAISIALNVFAPRNPPELDRILAPDGVLVVVAPTTDHLAGLVADLGLLTVAPDKAHRIAEQLAPAFLPSTQDVCEFELALSHGDVLSLVGMGPSAWHIGREASGERVAALPEPVRTTASVVVTAFRRA